jgi:hypothetical protein
VALFGVDAPAAMATLSELPGAAVSVDDASMDCIDRDVPPAYLHKPTVAPSSEAFEVLCGNCTGRHRVRFNWCVLRCVLFVRVGQRGGVGWGGGVGCVLLLAGGVVVTRGGLGRRLVSPCFVVPVRDRVHAWDDEAMYDARPTIQLSKFDHTPGAHVCDGLYVQKGAATCVSGVAVEALSAARPPPLMRGVHPSLPLVREHPICSSLPL